MDEHLVAEARVHVDALEELLGRMRYTTLQGKTVSLADQRQSMFFGLRAELDMWAGYPDTTNTA
jgi:hypothetical protein